MWQTENFNNQEWDMLRHELETAIETMQPGERLIYHTGYLLHDRNHGETFMRVENTARAAWEAMEAGKVHLVHTRSQQGQDGLWNYDYIVVKRKKPHKRIQWTGCYARYRTPHTTKVAA